jgi:hypothetical protein
MSPRQFFNKILSQTERIQRGSRTASAQVGVGERKGFRWLSQLGLPVLVAAVLVGLLPALANNQIVQAQTTNDRCDPESTLLKSISPTVKTTSGPNGVQYESWFEFAPVAGIKTYVLTVIEFTPDVIPPVKGRTHSLNLDNPPTGTNQSIMRVNSAGNIAVINHYGGGDPVAFPGEVAKIAAYYASITGRAEVRCVPGLTPPTSTSTTTTEPPSQVEVVDVRAPVSVAEAGPFAMEVDVRNTGKSELTAVRLRLPLAARIPRLDGASTSSNPLQVASLAEGETKTFVVTVTPLQRGKLVYDISAEGSADGQAVASNVRRKEIKIGTSDIVAVLELPPEGVFVGTPEASNVSVLLKVANVSSGDVTAMVPGVLSFPGGSLVSGPTPEIDPGPIAPNASRDFLYKLKATRVGIHPIRVPVTALSPSGPASDTAAAELAVDGLSLSIVSAPTTLDVDEEGDLVVEVTNNATNLSVKDVSIADPTSDGSGPGAIEVVTRPDGVTGGELAPKTSKSFRYKVKGKTLGKLRLVATATGKTDPSNIAFSATSAPVATEVTKASPLDIMIEPVAPGKLEIELEEDLDAKPIATKLKLKVTFKNSTERDLEAVTIQGPLSFLAVSTPKPDPFVIGVTSGPTPELPELGTLKPGEKKEITYEIEVGDEQESEIRQLATYWDPALRRNIPSTGKATLKAEKKTVLFFDVKVTDAVKAAGQIDGGESFLVVANVANRSTTKTIRIDDLRMTPFTAGVGDGRLSPGETSGVSPACRVPFAGKLAPGESKLLFGHVRTLPVGSRRLRAEWAHEGVVLSADSDGNKTETAIAPEKITLGQNGNKVELSIIEPLDLPSPVDLSTVYALGSGALEGVYQFMASGIDSITSLPGLAFDAVQRVLRVDPLQYSPFIRGVEAGQFLAGVWESLPEDEKAAFFGRVGEIAWESAKEKAETTGQTFEQFNTAVNQELTTYFSGIATEYYRGDFNALAQRLGYATGRIVPEIALCFLPQLEVAHVLAAADTARQTAFALRAITSIKTVELGRWIKSTETSLWGMSKVEAEFLKAYAKAKGMVFVFRSRGEKSIELIRRGLALPKPEFIKTKNVGKWEKYLGFVGNEDTVVLRKMSLSDLRQGVKRLEAEGGTPGEIAELTERWKERRADWDKYSEDYKAWDKKGKRGEKIKHQFNFSGNQVTDETVKKVLGDVEPQEFLFELERIPGDVEQYIVKLNDKLVTGDLDGLDVFYKNGKPLSLEDYAIVLQDLRFSPLQIQHPFSADFEILRARLGNFSDFVGSTGERLLQIGPDNIRAVTIDLSKSVFDTPTEAIKRKAYVHYTNGYRGGGKIVPVVREGLTWGRWIVNAVVDGKEIYNDRQDRVVVVTVRNRSGERRIEVNANEGFKLGDTIQINPGGANQEEAVITGFGSLILDRPLTFEHQPGEEIQIVSSTEDTPPSMLVFPALPPVVTTTAAPVPSAVPTTTTPPTSLANNPAVPATTTTLPSNIAQLVAIAAPSAAPTLTKNATQLGEPLSYTGADFQAELAFGLLVIAIGLLLKRKSALSDGRKHD